MKITFYSISNRTYFHKKGFALSLVLKVRVFKEHGNGPFDELKQTEGKQIIVSMRKVTCPSLLTPR